MSGGFSHTDIVGAVGQAGDFGAAASRPCGSTGFLILHRGIDAGNFTVVVAAVCAGNGSHAGSRRAVRLDNSGSSSAGDLTSLNIAGDLHGDGLADVVCAQRVLAGVVGRNLCCAVLIPLVVQIAGVVATGQRGGQLLAILQGAGDACRAGEGGRLEGRLDAHIITGHDELAVCVDAQIGGRLIIPLVKDIAAVGRGAQGDLRACRSSCGACAGRAVAVVLNGHGVGGGRDRLPDRIQRGIRRHGNACAGDHSAACARRPALELLVRRSSKAVCREHVFTGNIGYICHAACTAVSVKSHSVGRRRRRRDRVRAAGVGGGVVAHSIHQILHSAQFSSGIIFHFPEVVFKTCFAIHNRYSVIVVYMRIIVCVLDKLVFKIRVCDAKGCAVQRCCRRAAHLEPQRIDRKPVSGLLAIVGAIYAPEQHQECSSVIFAVQCRFLFCIGFVILIGQKTLDRRFPLLSCLSCYITYFIIACMQQRQF